MDSHGFSLGNLVNHLFPRANVKGIFILKNKKGVSIPCCVRCSSFEGNLFMLDQIICRHRCRCCCCRCCCCYCCCYFIYGSRDSEVVSVLVLVQIIDVSDQAFFPGTATHQAQLFKRFLFVRQLPGGFRQHEWLPIGLQGLTNKLEEVLEFLTRIKCAWTRKWRCSKMGESTNRK